MLVLSRRLNEKVLFPGFNTSVQILDFKGGKARLGIEAPKSVTVLREELQKGPMSMPRAADFAEFIRDDAPEQPVSMPSADDALQAKIRQMNHLLRNRLNVAGIGLALLTRQLQAGLLQDGQATLDKIYEDFELLRERLEIEVEEKKSVAPPAKAAKTLKALLVEDDQNERELLAGFLRISGMDVDIAGDGIDALEYLHTHARPDIVLLDMILPRCDGPTTVRQIRSDPAYNHLKIFGVTGHSPDSFHLDGVDRWFRKPLNPEVFLRDLNSEMKHSICN
jgi:carbon storage regulator CsrA